MTRKDVSDEDKVRLAEAYQRTYCVSKAARECGITRHVSDILVKQMLADGTIKPKPLDVEDVEMDKLFREWDAVTSALKPYFTKKPKKSQFRTMYNY